MSKLTKKPIKILSGVTLKQDGGELIFNGPKGERKLKLLPYIKIELNSDSVRVEAESNMKQAKMNEGTVWSLIKSAIDGVAHGFSKNLEINGIGYKAAMEGKTLVLSLGFSHPIRFNPPDGITIVLEKNTIKVSGVNKEMVGQAAAEIRAFKKPEPYKGKGIRYEGEVVRRKTGKKAASAGAAA